MTRFLSLLQRLSAHGLAPTLVLAAVVAPSAAAAETVLYVSANGDDAVSGLSRASALRTPEKALEKSQGMRGDVRLVLSGKFDRDRPIVIDRKLRGLVLESDPRRPAVLRARGVVGAAVVAYADRVKISGLTIIGYRDRGIFVSDARYATIRNNRISEIRSTGWSQGAIHLTGSTAGAVIDSNIINGADYAGILVDTKITSDVSNITITRNRISQTCRRVADCGAIYINDRGRRSSGSRIAYNTVNDFGPQEAKGRGIYLDDWASHVLVEGNRVEGRGSFAFQIHGGNYNVIRNNTVALGAFTEPFLYQRHVSQASWPAMSGNVIIDNEYSGARFASLFGNRDVPLQARPQMRGNRLCSAGQCRTLER